MNVNDYVWVKLTKDGRRIYAEYHAQFAHMGITAPQPAHGWVRFQMWDLMNLFGSHCGLGLLSPFEHGEIRLEDPAQSVEVEIPTREDNDQ